MEGLSLYTERNLRRTIVLENATMSFVQYFIELGDDLVTANSKVSQLSTEVAQYIYVYTLGNTKPLLDSINASTLPFMDNAAKEKLVEDLSKF